MYPKDSEKLELLLEVFADERVELILWDNNYDLKCRSTESRHTFDHLLVGADEEIIEDLNDTLLAFLHAKVAGNSEQRLHRPPFDIDIWVVHQL